MLSFRWSVLIGLALCAIAIPTSSPASDVRSTPSAVQAAALPATPFSEPLQVLPDAPGGNQGLGDYLTHVSCPSEQLCFVTGQGPHESPVLVSTDPSNPTTSADGFASAWRGPVRGILGRASSLRGVSSISCPLSKLCVAAGSNRRGPAVAISSNAGADNASWRLVNLPHGSKGSAKSLGGAGPIACVSNKFCVALGYNSAVFAPMWRTTKPTGGSSDWKVSYFPRLPLHNGSFSNVTCPSISLCVGVGSRGWVGVLRHPTRAGSTWKVSKLRGGASVPEGLSCPTVSFCITFYAPAASDSATRTMYTTTDGAKSWKRTAFGLGVEDVSCGSPSFCVAIGVVGISGGHPKTQSYITTTPTAGPSGWKVFPAGSDLEAVSCPSTRLCVEAGGKHVATLVIPPP